VRLMRGCCRVASALSPPALSLLYLLNKREKGSPPRKAEVMTEEESSERATAEHACRSVYVETLAHYQKLAPAMGERAYGFKILYGPPIINAPALFVGQQPAGNHQRGVDGKAAGERIGWPNRTEYAFHSWPLARKMRSVWSVSLLDRCTGLNANFFRAPNDKEWRKALPAPLRREALAFCSPRVEALARALRPRCVVVIGLAVFDELSQSIGTVALSEGRRTLVKRCVLWGCKAYGTIHLSGAYPALSDNAFGLMRSYFDEQISS
jgi:hypothetical protein